MDSSRQTRFDSSHTEIENKAVTKFYLTSPEAKENAIKDIEEILPCKCRVGDEGDAEKLEEWSAEDTY